MIAALALMAGAVGVAMLGHRPLLRWGARWRDPFTVMSCWLLSIAGVLVTFAVSAVLLILPGDRPGEWAEHFAHGCWLVGAHARVPAVDEAAGAAALTVLSWVGVRFCRALRHRVRAQHAVHDRHITLLRIMGNPGDDPVLWLEHSAPFAYSVAGSPGVVVASTSLRTLPQPQQSAVLNHERAHLRRRHHLLVLVAGALAHAVPCVPLIRRAPDALALLVEIDADDQAVRSCGHGAVRDALLAVSHDPTISPTAALAVAGGDIAHRLRLLRDTPGAGPVRLAAMRATAVIGPAVLPGVVSLSTLVLALALSCPHA